MPKFSLPLLPAAMARWVIRNGRLQMNARMFDPRGPRGKRTSRTIRRFLAMVGLLPRAAARSADRHDPRKPCEQIPVWDAKLGAFRDVDPENRHDPLRESARQLAALRAALSRNQ